MKKESFFVLAMLVLSVASQCGSGPAFGAYIAGWGDNNSGQCDVPIGSDFVAIAGGKHYGVALKSDGSLVGWGSPGEREVPIGNNFTAIAAHYTHSVALKSDGSLAAWGDNGHGQCNVPAGNNFVAIAAAEAHSLALKTDGSLVAWGSQSDVPAGNDFVDIAAGGSHSLALKTDGSLVAWGYNGSGQCDVPAGNDFVDIAAGTDHSLAIKSDGSLAAWGSQSNVPAGNNFVGIASGIYYGLALVIEPVLMVEIDIKPGSYPNSINLGSQGVIPVAILSSSEFDATTVDPDTVELAGAGVAVRGKADKYMAHEEDINGDGLTDLLVQVETENLDPETFQYGFMDLTGETYDGVPIKGEDEIIIVPPEK